MGDVYIYFIVILFALALADLVVGVSNDAVNFLNSAIGSRVATRRTIMIVASLGICAGSLFSSGMMEVARKGIFSPELFTFADVMVVFAAVMFTDIILLDLFNTLGMPTSTTVSIVFELLGAALVVAIIVVFRTDGGLPEIADYINSSSALIIIAGIFASVVVAFFVGAIAQYGSRLLFSFEFKRRLPYVGGVWAGAALTVLSYFLLIKGLKGASFVPVDFVAWVKGNTVAVLAAMFVLSSLLMQALIMLKINILRLVVLLGTFALAMAFASNDLVNFIGVPMAGFESYQSWSGSGVAADGYLMSSLNEPVQTSSLYLLGAGAVMVATLWLSAKARSVTETEINLGRQGAGVERFTANTLSRTIVRAARDMGGLFGKLVSRRWRARINSSFEAPSVKPTKDSAPAFDTIRASVNLTIASALIALATSLKLPLSTTYVSFMVAMGTSLADRAWDRETAVFRVAGVLNVIGGWLLTAIIALTVSGCFAAFIYFLGIYGVFALLVVVALSYRRSSQFHRQREKDLAARGAVYKVQSLTVSTVLDETTALVARALDDVAAAYSLAITALIEEDTKSARLAREKIRLLRKENTLLGSNLHHYVQRISENDVEGSRVYVAIYDHLQDLLQSSSFVVESCINHLLNVHRPPSQKQRETLRSLSGLVEGYLSSVNLRVAAGDFTRIEPELEQKDTLLIAIDERLDDQIADIKSETVSEVNSGLMFSILLESRDLAAITARFLKFYSRHLKSGHVETGASSDTPQDHLVA